jgi:hypothetical protein
LALNFFQVHLIDTPTQLPPKALLKLGTKLENLLQLQRRRVGTYTEKTGREPGHYLILSNIFIGQETIAGNHKSLFNNGFYGWELLVVITEVMVALVADVGTNFFASQGLGDRMRPLIERVRIGRLLQAPDTFFGFYAHLSLAS